MLSNANSKLSKSFDDTIKVMSFGLNVDDTCKSCKIPCYAKQGHYAIKNGSTYKKRKNNYSYVQLNDFIVRMNYHLEQARPKRGKKTKLVVRIHDSGDFFSESYADNWIEICEQNKDVYFYAYTKRVDLFAYRYDRLPSNLRIIFSFGSTFDHMIDTTKHYHCHIFNSAIDLRWAGYNDTSNNDAIAAMGHSKHIGIVFHHPSKKVRDKGFTTLKPSYSKWLGVYTNDQSLNSENIKMY